jgi:hypothetical protein
MRCNPSGIWILEWACIATLAALVAAPALADEYADNVARLEKLTPEQKEDLLRKKQRFDNLSPQEQHRLRDLHQALSSAPDAAQLSRVMSRYSDWLKNLEANQRAALLLLPPGERIEKIKELVREQEGRRLGTYVNYNLPDSDRTAIYRFLDQFVEGHEEEILDRVRGDRERGWIKGIKDSKARRRVLIPHLRSHYIDSMMPFPAKEEIEVLVASLSETTRKELDRGSTDSDRDSRRRELVYAAISSIAMRRPSKEELQKYYAGLSADRRARLDTMEPEKMNQELNRMYQRDRFRPTKGVSPPPGVFGSPGGGFGPPPGGSRGGSPRGDGGRNDGGDRRGDGEGSKPNEKFKPAEKKTD